MSNLYGKSFNRKLISTILISLLILSSFSLVFAGVEQATSEPVEGATHELVLLTTNDIHAYVMPYDYLTDTDDASFGLARTATLVEKLRAEYDNTLLVDAGDTIQGSMLGEIEAEVHPLEPGEVHAVIKAMNEMGYDVGAIGNHEFNFGLDFLDNVVAGAEFPMIVANVYDAETHENRFTPYVIQEHEIDGDPVSIGFIGFAPPQIMLWDRLHLEDEVYAEEIVETAEKFVPQMKEEGADLIVALAHTGIDIGDRTSENAAYYLSLVDGIDAMVLGHSHARFPGDSRYDDIEGVDNEKGTVNGVPAVMAGSWGRHLGEIKLDLSYDDGEWEVFGSASKVHDARNEAPKQSIVDLVEERHNLVLDYIRTPVGKLSSEINAFFAKVADNKVTQLVNQAQLWYAEKTPLEAEYEDLPVLSAAAPFRLQTQVDAGDITISDVVDIYIYSNTLQIVKVDGEELVGWLEKLAENFKQIDPTVTEEQNILADGFPAFNFDHIEGIEYNIDITKPVGERIVNLTYEGQPVTDDMEFLVVTNNYRAGGGGDHLTDANIIHSSLQQNREVIIDYIREEEEVDVELTNNWSILPVETAGDLVFEAHENAKDYYDAVGVKNVSHVRDNTYKLDFETVPSELPSVELLRPDRYESVQPNATIPFRFATLNPEGEAEDMENIVVKVLDGEEEIAVYTQEGRGASAVRSVGKEGEYMVNINTRALGLSPGVYTIAIEIEGETIYYTTITLEAQGRNNGNGRNAA